MEMLGKRRLRRIAERIDEATPASRDRYLDFLRVVAILMVIVGHWVVRVVVEQDGVLVSRYLLDISPAWQWVTLVWQVMPVFFLVGGLINAQSWRRAREEGERPVDWMRGRARRLLFPMLPVLAALSVAGALVHLTVGTEALIFGLDVAIIPMWFLAAYLMVICLTPATLDLHERGRGWSLVLVFMLIIVAVDIFRFTIGGPTVANQPAIAAVNFIFVWVVIHQVGYYWADDRLPARAMGQMALLVGSAALLAVMIGSGFYPLTMIPVEGSDQPNNGSPPTAALIVLGLAQLALALLLRRPVEAWLHRPLAWAPIGLMGPKLISLFLWHQAVMVAVAHVVYPLALLPVTQDVDAVWWWSRPLWVLYCALPLAAVVLLVRPIDEPPAGVEAREGGAWATGSGVVLFSAGIAGLVATDMHMEAMPLGLPWPALLAVLGGMAALGALRLADFRPARAARG